MIGRNIISMSGLSCSKTAVQFAMNIALAIFITPSELGLVVFTIPFVTFVSMFADFGMGSALVATDKLSRVQAGAALSLTVCLGLSCATLMVLAAAPVAGLAHLPGLTGVMVAMSAGKSVV